MIEFLAFLLIAAIVCWFISKLNLPQPLQMVVYFIIALVAIGLVCDVTGIQIPGVHLPKLR